MHNQTKREIEMIARVTQFVSLPELSSTPRGTELVTQLKTLSASLETLSRMQISGRGENLGGAAARRRSKGELLDSMREISETAKGLESEFPGISRKFQVPSKRSFVATVVAARAFAAEAEQMKQEFINFAMPPDFVEKLQGLIAEFEQTTDRRNAGLGDQVRGTAGLAATAREATAIVRKLNAVVRNQFRKDPARLAQWRTASRVERYSRPAAAVPVVPEVV